jgi:hypothetical protein
MIDCSTVSVTMRGPADAVLTASGPVGTGVAARVSDLLSTVLACGAEHVIVDLAEARDVPVELLDLLLTTSWTVAERGGFLLVEGAQAGDPHGDLLDAFRAYRDTVAA